MDEEARLVDHRARSIRARGVAQAKASKWKSDWVRIKDAVYQQVLNYGIESLSRDHVLGHASRILGFPIERPHLINMCENMYSEMMKKYA